MSPSCVCDAARHPPAHTGMNAQSPHSFHGFSRSNFSRALLAPRVAAVVDMAGRERLLAGEARAGVERSVGADRVRVRHVHVARAVVHAVGRREAVPLRLLAQERIWSSSERQRVARRRRRRRRPTSCTCRRAACRRRADRHQREHALRRRHAARRRGSTGLKLTLTSLSAKSCALRKSSSAGIAVGRALVEVAADRDAARGRRRCGCSRRCGRRCPGRRAAAACGCACRDRRRA